MAMEINGLNNNQGNTSKTKSGGSVVAPKNSKADATSNTDSTTSKETVRISPEGQTLSRLSKQLGSDTPVNREKVEALKAAIDDGTYEVNPQELAKKMLREDSLF